MSDLVKPLAASVVHVVLSDLRERVTVIERGGLGPRTTRARLRCIKEELAKLQQYATEHGVLTRKNCARLNRIRLTA